MSNYYFQLGNTPQLSIQELNSVLGVDNVAWVGDQLAKAELSGDEYAKQIVDWLGGTIKIIREINNVSNLDLDALTQEVVGYITQKASGGKVHFALSELGRDHLPQIESYDIKALLQKDGIVTRYVEGSRHGLSAAILLHKKNVVELYLLQTQEGIFLAETVAVQDIDDWTNKDRNKPYSDRKKGMLPPKVALMMVNIALGDNPTSDTGKNVLLDPFCGTGTVLIEGLLTDRVEVIGADLDPESVAGTKKNLEWLQECYPFKNSFKVMLSDATKIPPLSDPINYIVTEPFLGKPKPNTAKLPYIFKGLEKLYLGAFKHWTKLLADGASICIVFPTVTTKNRKDQDISFNLDSLIDKLATFGYTMLSEPILYHRPQAIVQRQIYRFRFNK